MRLLRRSVAAGLSTATAALALVLTASPAQSAQACTFRPPARIAISAPYATVPVSWSGDCSTVQEAHWTVYHPTEGPEASVTYGDVSVDVYHWFGRGDWAWQGSGAWDSAWNALPQNTPHTEVRLGTSAHLTLSRSGSTVTASTRTSRYSPEAGAWAGYRPSARAYLQWRSATGSFVDVAALSPDASGVDRVTVTATQPMYFRIRIPASRLDGTWGTYSPGQLK